MNNKRLESQSNNTGEDKKINLTDSKDVLVIEKHSRPRNGRKIDPGEGKEAIRQKDISLTPLEEESKTNTSFFPFQSNLRNTQMVKQL